MYGTPLALASPLLNVPSNSNVQHFAHLRTRAALSVPQSLPRAPSYAEILSRGTSSAPSAALYSPQPISTVRPSISACPLNRPAQLQHTHLHDQRRAPSRLCNVVPIPSVPASTVDPTGNTIPGLTPFLPHPLILASPDAHRDTRKVAYTGLERINPSVMTQRCRYSDAVKGKGPIEHVKVLHHVPSRSVPPPSRRPHNASSASVDRRYGSDYLRWLTKQFYCRRQSPATGKTFTLPLKPRWSLLDILFQMHTIPPFTSVTLPLAYVPPLPFPLPPLPIRCSFVSLPHQKLRLARSIPSLLRMNGLHRSSDVPNSSVSDRVLAL